MKADDVDGSGLEQIRSDAPTLDWANQTVLVTGAGGFIGSHLVERLLAEGASVLAFIHYNSRNDKGFLSNLENGNKRLRIVAGDICELDAVRSMVKGLDVIFHLAALVGIPYSYQHVHQVIEVNTMGTLNILTAGKENGVKRIIHTSTSEVYGTAKAIPMDENHPKRAQSPYAASKIAADAIAMTHYLSFGLPVSICRPFNTYGPRQSDRAIIPSLISQALSKREIVVGNMRPTRDFTYVSDTVAGFIKVAECSSCIGEEIIWEQAARSALNLWLRRSSNLWDGTLELLVLRRGCGPQAVKSSDSVRITLRHEPWRDGVRW